MLPCMTSRLKPKWHLTQFQSSKLDYDKAADVTEALIGEMETYQSDQKSVDYLEKSLDSW